MWAIRRASTHLRLLGGKRNELVKFVIVLFLIFIAEENFEGQLFKNRGLSSEAGRLWFGKSEIERCCLENYGGGIIEPQEKFIGGSVSCTRSYNKLSSSSKSCRQVLAFSSKAGAECSDLEDNDDLEAGFFELETPLKTAEKAAFGNMSDDGLISNSDLSEDEGITASSAMTEAILAAPASSVSTVLNKWVEEGNKVTQSEVLSTVDHLQRQRMFVKALKLLEWFESTKTLELSESHYSTRLDLTAKLRGVVEAEQYLMQIPESFRGELVYRILLANCLSANDVKKSKEVLNKMQDLGFHLSSFTCNQMLLLYKKTDKTKIADVLRLMEKKNFKPSLFTYQVLIDAKGQSYDIKGMEQIVKRMKSEGLKPIKQMKASLARHYANADLKDRAETVLKSIEGDDKSKSTIKKLYDAI